MILILLSWIFILCICYLCGFFISTSIFKLKTISETIIVGIIAVTLIANIIAFLFPIRNSLIISIVITSILNLLMYFKEIKLQLLRTKSELYNFKNIILFLFSAILFAAYSSGYSNINDDGLYYTQTIMWLRKYGFVHGISNLHLSLGLSSSWHVFQAIFTFSDSINLNDVNGFLMLVFTLFIIEKKSSENNNFFYYFQYFLVLLVSIPFYNAPNPDFAIIVFTAIALQLFLTSNNQEKYPIILVLAMYCFTIKISAILIVMLAIYCAFQLLKLSEFKTQYKTYLLILAMFAIQVSKNIYQTGYSLYPYKILSVNVDWKTPETIVSYFTNGVKTWSYSNKFKPIDVDKIKEISPIQLFKSLIFRTGTKGIINQIIFASFIFSILLISYLWYKKKLDQKTIVLQLITGLSLIIWFVFAPQYRFAIPMLIYYLAFIFYLIYNHIIQRYFKLNLYLIHLLIIIILFIPTFIGLKISGNETSKQIGQFEQIKSEQIILPMPKYSFIKMDTITVNTTNFYHVNGNIYCWNSPLPCMSKGYEKIIFENFHYRISLRGETLAEGFKFIYYQ